MSYEFKGKYKQDAPRQEQYTFYISAKDQSGNYAEPDSILLQHPGIQKLNTPKVKGLISSIKIELPTVYSKRSQTGNPNDTESEEKDILGYRLHIQEVDYDTEAPIGDEEIVDIPVITWDERLSTIAAERTLIEADMSRAKRKDVIDKMAAVVILQNYLDSKS